jgi:hypothetical protein
VTEIPQPLEVRRRPDLAAFGEFSGGSKHRRPTTPVPLEPRVGADYATPPASGLRVTWLGHATTLLEVEDAAAVRPGGRTRVVRRFAGPKRFFHCRCPSPSFRVDAIVLSHDHYDHLDRAFVEAKAAGTSLDRPLGVGGGCASGRRGGRHH